MDQEGPEHWLGPCDTDLMFFLFIAPGLNNSAQLSHHLLPPSYTFRGVADR